MIKTRSAFVVIGSSHHSADRRTLRHARPVFSEISCHPGCLCDLAVARQLQTDDVRLRENLAQSRVHFQPRRVWYAQRTVVDEHDFYLGAGE
jgi:hypothetical protein